MLKKFVITFAAIILILAGLLLPALFSEDRQPLVGPDISSLSYEEITFNNGDLQFGGMLFVPEGEGPFQTAVIIHGSGTSRRNSKWYLSVASHLQENGIAVLLPDKRGSEKSEGSWVGADFETLAGDTLAAVDHVRKEELFKHSGTGLIGMSQGGWIAPVAASRDDYIDFVVSMSGASVTAREQITHEEVHNISRFTWPFVARLLAPITAKRIMKMDHIRAYADFDPIPYWKKVTAPVFFAFGENDENVPVDASLDVVRSRLEVGLVKVYPDGGHAIRNIDNNRVSERFLDDLVAFIKTSLED